MFSAFKNKVQDMQRRYSIKKSLSNVGLTCIHKQLYVCDDDENIEWNNVVKVIGDMVKDSKIKVWLIGRVVAKPPLNGIVEHEIGSDKQVDTMLTFTRSMKQYIETSPTNICIYICKDRKDIIAACLFCMLGITQTAYDGLNMYRTKTKNRLLNVFDRNKLSSSMTRFLADFTLLSQKQVEGPPPSLKLANVVIHKLPKMDRNGCRVLLTITQGYKFLYSSFQHGQGVIWVPSTTDEPMSVSVPIYINMSGACVLKCYHVPERLSTDNPRRLLFTVHFHTSVAALQPQKRLLLRKDELDIQMGLIFHKDFRVQILFEDVVEVVETPCQTMKKDDDDEKKEDIKHISSTPSPIHMMKTPGICIERSPSGFMPQTTPTTNINDLSLELRPPSPTIQDPIMILPANVPFDDDDDDDNGSDGGNNQENNNEEEEEKAARISTDVATIQQTQSHDTNVQEELDQMIARALQMQFDREARGIHVSEEQQHQEQQQEEEQEQEQETVDERLSIQRRHSAPATIDADELLARQLHEELNAGLFDLNQSTTTSTSSSSSRRRRIVAPSHRSQSVRQPTTTSHRSTIRNPMESAAAVLENLLANSGIRRSSLTRLRRSRSHGAQIISILPEFECKGGKFLQEECQICREAFVLDDKIRTLPCIHSYHSACIDRWLVERVTCPVCLHRIADQI